MSVCAGGQLIAHARSHSRSTLCWSVSEKNTNSERKYDVQRSVSIRKENRLARALVTNLRAVRFDRFAIVQHFCRVVPLNERGNNRSSTQEDPVARCCATSPLILRQRLFEFSARDARESAVIRGERNESVCSLMACSKVRERLNRTAEENWMFAKESSVVLSRQSIWQLSVAPPWRVNIITFITIRSDRRD